MRENINICKIYSKNFGQYKSLNIKLVENMHYIHDHTCTYNLLRFIVKVVFRWLWMPHNFYEWYCVSLLYMVSFQD